MFTLTKERVAFLPMALVLILLSVSALPRAPRLVAQAVALRPNVPSSYRRPERRPRLNVLV
jgi:hypothetical protein